MLRPLERSADEEAGAEVADRRLVARAIARAAGLALHRSAPGPVTAIAATPGRRRLSLAVAGAAATVSPGIAVPLACTEAPAHL
ncbi:hypothetical protein ABZX95_15710 [Streptomyces sp. NPDC004232]|uniref:hypothetical protein n=1 Tax=Streptomyces sp. NPDC004232 TaxID=3154454 RepID=UPI0033AADE8F